MMIRRKESVREEIGFSLQNSKLLRQIGLKQIKQEKHQGLRALKS